MNGDHDMDDHDMEKKEKDEEDRQGRKNIRKKLRLRSVGIEQFEEYQEDLLEFKDSERESIVSYIE